MLQRDGYPPGVPCFVVTSQPDPVAAARFYGDLFGWSCSEPFDVFDAHRMAVCADPQGARFALWQAGAHIGARVVDAPGSWNWSDLHTTDAEARPHWAVTFAVDGTDEVADRAAQLGAAVVTAPYGAGPTRIAGLRDPQGAPFAITTYRPGSDAT